MAEESLLRYVPADVRYERRELPADQNALGPWTAAVAAMHDRRLDDRVWGELLWGTHEQQMARLSGAKEPDDPPIPTGAERAALDDSLEQNRKAFALIDEGLARGRLQLPPENYHDVSADVADQLADSVRRLGMLRFGRAKLLAADGEMEAAAAEFAAVWAMGRMLSRSGSVLPCMMSSWLRNGGLAGLGRADLAPAVDTSTRAALAEEAAQEPADSGGADNSLRIRLCEYSVPLVNRLPCSDSPDALIDALLARFYDDRTMDDVIGGDPLPVDVQRQRLATRRRQLEILLAGHPQLFDPADTVRLLGVATAQAIAGLRRDPKAWRTKLHNRWRWRWSHWRDRPGRRLDRSWPHALRPGTPFDVIGTDERAVRERDELRSYSGRRVAAALAPVADGNLPRLRQRLRRVENPVGKILAELLAPVALGWTVWQYRRELRATLAAVESAAAPGR